MQGSERRGPHLQEEEKEKGIEMREQKERLPPGQSGPGGGPRYSILWEKSKDWPGDGRKGDFCIWVARGCGCTGAACPPEGRRGPRMRLGQ